MKLYKAFCNTCQRDTKQKLMLSLAIQNWIGDTKQDHPVLHCFPLTAAEANFIWQQVQSWSLPTSDLGISAS